MIINRILVSNLGPFLGEWEIELPHGVTAVVADYEGEVARSNRGGKSYIAVDAPDYALFGKFRGRSVEDVVHRLARGKEDGFSEVEVENSEGTRYVVRQGRTASGDPIRLLDGLPIKEVDLEKVVVEEILGLSREEYRLTNVCVQGDMNAFLRMTPAEKRRIVSPWFKTDRWIPRYELARVRLLDAKAGLAKLDVLEERALKTTERAGVVREALADVETRFGVARETVETSLVRVANARTSVAAQSERTAEFNRVTREVARLAADVEREISDAEREKSTASSELASARAARAGAVRRADEIARLEALAAGAEETRELVEEIRARRRDEKDLAVRTGVALADLRTKYEELKGSRTGTCPILRESCARVSLDPNLIEEMKREGLASRRSISRIDDLVKDLSWKLDAARMDLGNAEDAAREARRLAGEATVAQVDHDLEVATRRRDAADAALSRLRTSGSETTKALRRSRAELERLGEPGGDEETRELAAASEELQDARNALEVLEESRAALAAELAEVRRAEVELTGLAARRAAARSEVERVAWAVYAFGSAGIPSRELENAFGVAEGSMNSVLEDLGASTRLRFAPTRELGTWEPACLACGYAYPKGERTHVCAECGIARRRRQRDELRLEVLDNGNESAFELDSGGGQVLLSLGSRFGLAALPGMSRRVRCEHAVVDEPDGALDAPNRAALHRLLLTRLPVLGIKQVILITHADVRDEFPSVVVVHRWEAEDRSGVWMES